MFFCSFVHIFRANGIWQRRTPFSLAFWDSEQSRSWDGARNWKCFPKVHEIWYMFADWKTGSPKERDSVLTRNHPKISTIWTQVRKIRRFAYEWKHVKVPRFIHVVKIFEMTFVNAECQYCIKAMLLFTAYVNDFEEKKNFSCSISSHFLMK